MSAAPAVAIFDINETLLDLAVLDPHFETAFGDRATRHQWFQQLLQSAFTATIIDSYADFAEIGRSALSMVAELHGDDLPEAEKKQILETIKTLPAHRDVEPALARLREGGIRLAALTNSPLATVEAQLEAAGVSHLFERILSCDTIRRYKPAPEPYRMAVEEMGVDPGRAILVACHAWDTAGAMKAGLQAAFVARPGKVLDPLFPRPTVVGEDLLTVGAGILALAER